jgi:hypothetical protein
VEEVRAGVVDEAVRLVQVMGLGAVVARLEREDMAAAPTTFVGAGVEECTRRAPAAERLVDEQVGDPTLGRRPVQPWLNPEADGTRELAVHLGDVNPTLRMVEMCDEDVTLGLRVVGDGRPREVLHELEDSVGVAGLGLADDHGIDR